MFVIEDKKIGLMQYTHDDDRDMYDCWMDVDTQKGFNILFNESFEEFCSFKIDEYRFWVTVYDKSKNRRVGTIRLGLDEIYPDLAIWIYPDHRHLGYGTSAYKLALRYLFERYGFSKLSAGSYSNNLSSIKMLKNLGFVRCHERDSMETSVFTGETITQLEFLITQEQFHKLHHLSFTK